MMKFYQVHIKSLARFILFTVFCCFFASDYSMLFAQDIQFSQFDYAPMFINPSNTGNFNGDWRVAGNFRNQWKNADNPFRTSMVSFDKQIFVLNQKIGAGAYFINDESGVGKMSYNKLYASLGYNTIINNNGFGVGIQAGYVFGNMNDWGTFNHNTGIFDSPSGEPASNYKSRYLDLNFGVNYKRSIAIFHPEAGFSLLHINKPSNSYLDDNSVKKAVRYILYATVKTNLGDKIYVTPKVLVSGEVETGQEIFGAEAGWNLVGKKTTVKRLFGGVYARNGTTGMDALMAQLGATIGRLDVGINYDMYLSNINSSGNMGAFEITFIYKSISTILNSYSIPCERY